MGFSTKRGRPKKKDSTTSGSEKDLGTMELQKKRSQGLTKEMVDLAKEKSLISDEEFSAAMHFRWLYTLRFGAPTVTAIDLNGLYGREIKRNDEIWQSEREKEYAMAAEKLRAAGALRIVMNIVIFNLRPKFLSARDLRAGNLQEISEELKKFREGLGLMAKMWENGYNK